jgi:23S rRNA (guanosine2251-2'-O)-methyltransferase
VYNNHKDKFSDKKDKNTCVFGIRAVIEAVNAGKELEKVYVQKGLQGELFFELQKVLKNAGLNYQPVPGEKINKIAGYRNHQGVVAILSSITYQDIEKIIPTVFEEGKVPLVIVLDRITDVRNFGAIARTCECSGVDAIVIPSRGAAQINSDAIKTSAGALHKVPVCRSDNLKTTLDFLHGSGLQIVACSEDTKKMYYEIDLTLPTALIFGSEEDGISGEYLKRADETIAIPILGTIESLNVSVAAGIILYETIRQRK